VSTGAVAEVIGLLDEAADALDAAAGPGAGADALIAVLAVLAVSQRMARRMDRAAVALVAALDRQGVFAERGYKSVAGALADLLGWERFEASAGGAGRQGPAARCGPVDPDHPGRVAAGGGRAGRGLRIPGLWATAVVV
jgi:5-methylcytosine-specific restriction protein A